MISNTIEKLTFGIILVLLFQVPILSGQYLQFVNGYYAAQKEQIDGYKENAALHKYIDVHAMITDLLKNNSDVIKMDTLQKQHTIHQYEESEKAIKTLKNDNIFLKAWFMFNPTRWETLKKVFVNFEPGIPLKLSYIVYSVLLSLFLSTLIVWPFRRAVIKPSITL